MYFTIAGDGQRSPLFQSRGARSIIILLEMYIENCRAVATTPIISNADIVIDRLSRSSRLTGRMKSDTENISSETCILRIASSMSKVKAMAPRLEHQKSARLGLASERP
jgi:hypothetical protein